MKRLNATLIALFFFTLICTAQEGFRFKRNIDGIKNEGWHAITLPSDIFTQLNRNLSDIRLFALKGSDTLEIAYILDVQANVETSSKVKLPVLNKSYRDGALYLMFELNASQPVNYLDLNFTERNYFGRVDLQGSDDRRRWFDIITDQRIVAVDKENGDYKLSRIDFPRTDYRFLRIRVQADVPLTFESVSFQHNEIRKGEFRDMPLTWNSREEEKARQTIFNIRLQDYAPVSSIEVKADSMRDYYRPMRIEFVADSFKTDKGWTKFYETLYEGHLTSFRPNDFTFPWKLAREIRMVITNFDDEPIAVHEISVAGPKVNLVAKLEPGNNFMLYGCNDLRPPLYDLAFFNSSIPDSLAPANLGSAEPLVMAAPAREALFENKIWLWTIMAVMIVGLGFFTFRMMKAQP